MFTYERRKIEHRASGPRATFPAILEDQSTRIWRRAADVELHTQLVIELISECPLRSYVTVPQLTRHGGLHSPAQLLTSVLEMTV